MMSISAKHILPCHCGKGHLEVDSSQSGLTLPCPACGTNLEVPTLRGLRQLRMVATPGVGQRSVPEWGPRQGLLLVAVILMGFGLGWGGARLAPTIGNSQVDNPQLYLHENATLKETWIYFDYLEQTRLTNESHGMIDAINAQYEKEQLMTWALLGFGMLGVVLAVLALTVVRPRKRPRQLMHGD